MERPIAYSTEMVEAILAERKTMTRRMVKFQSELNHANISHIGELLNHKSGKRWAKFRHKISSVYEIDVLCPYGQEGDILWVREEHLITFSEDKCWITVEFKDGYKFTVYYKDLSFNLLKRLYKRKTIGKWQRARFLPKEFARLWLKVTNVRVERLQDISEEDAIAEGIEQLFADTSEWGYYKNYKESEPLATLNPYRSFATLWQSINGEQSWIDNPWVWVIEFEEVSSTGRDNVKEVKA